MNGALVNKRGVFNKLWILPVICFLCALYLLLKFTIEYNVRQENYHSAKNTVRAFSGGFARLPENGKDRIRGLSMRAALIVYNHLDGRDKIEFADLSQKPAASEKDYFRKQILWERARPKLTVEEKLVVEEFEKAITELAGAK